MTFDTKIFFTYLFKTSFLSAAWVTIWVAVVAQIIGNLIGLVSALFEISGKPVLQYISRFYIWVWRAIPPLIQLLIFFLGLPQLGIRLTVIQAGLLGLGLLQGAYMSEIIRSGLMTVDKGQIEAAKSLGLNYFQIIGRIVLPQAVRVILPPHGNEFNSLLRTTSLLSVISLEELLRVTTQAINETYRAVELYAVAAVYYLAMTTTWNLIQALLEKKFYIVEGHKSNRDDGIFTIIYQQIKALIPDRVIKPG